MRRHESLAVVSDERQQVGALRGCEIDLADAEEEDRVEVVEIAYVELLAGRDPGPRWKRDRLLRDQLRIGPDERVVRARLAAEALDDRDGVRDGIVLIAVANVGPGEHVLFRGKLRLRRQRGAREKDDECAVQLRIWNSEFGIRGQHSEFQIPGS